jgi:hypothetical protein
LTLKKPKREHRDKLQAIVAVMESVQLSNVGPEEQWFDVAHKLQRLHELLKPFREDESQKDSELLKALLKVYNYSHSQLTNVTLLLGKFNESTSSSLNRLRVIWRKMLACFMRSIDGSVLLPLNQQVQVKRSQLILPPR